MAYRIEMHNFGGLLDMIKCDTESGTVNAMTKLVRSCGVLNHGDKFFVINEEIENED